MPPKCDNTFDEDNSRVPITRQYIVYLINVMLFVKRKTFIKSTSLIVVKQRFFSRELQFRFVKPPADMILFVT